jgi:MFS family permease
MNPFLAAPNSKKLMTLIGIYLGIVASIMVSSSLSTLLPTAAADIGGADIYALASPISGILGIAAMPLYGSLGARNPALKRPLVALSMLVGALVIFSRAVAPNMMLIIVTSVFWGLVSAGIYVISFTMIRDMYDQAKAGTFLGAVGTVMSLGMLIGPVLAGFIIDNFSWRLVNHIIWVLLLLSALLVFFGVKAAKKECEDMAVSGGAFDFMGALALIAFLVGTIMSLSLGGSYLKFGTVANYALIALAVVGLVALVFIIRKKGAHAIIPSTVLADRNTLAMAAYNFFNNFSLMAAFFFIPSYVIYVLQGSATEAALTTTLISVIGVFAGPFLGRMMAKAGNSRTITTIGNVIRILVTAALLIFVRPDMPLILLYVIMFMAGLYNTQHTVTVSTTPQIQIRQEIRPLSNSVISVAQNIGGGVGVAVYTMVIAMFGLEGGMSIAFILAIVTAAGALVAGLFLKKMDASEA